LGGIIDILGFMACLILVFAWLESKIPKSRKRRLEDLEMTAKAKKDLIRAIEKHNENKELKTKN